MPPAVTPRSIEALSDGPRGGGVFTQQERADLWIGEIRFVNEIDEPTADRAGRLRESDEPVHSLGKFGGAAWTVTHLARDEAWIDGAGAHDARKRCTERARARAFRVGHIQHDQIGSSA